MSHSTADYPARILKALAEVRAAVPGVPKTGKNATYGYAYSSEADVLAAYNPAMNEAGLIVLPAVLESHERPVRTSRGGESCVTRVVMEFTLAHRDGDVWPVPLRWEASGEDAQDKGLAKAITSATKYFLTSLFQAEKGTDPDAAPGTAPPSPRPSPPVNVGRGSPTRVPRQGKVQCERQGQVPAHARGGPESGSAAPSSPAPLPRDAAPTPAASAGTAQGAPAALAPGRSPPAIGRCAPGARLSPPDGSDRAARRTPPLTVLEFKRLWRKAVATAGADAAWDFWLSVCEPLQGACASLGEWAHVCKVVKDGMARLGVPKEHAGDGLPSWQERHGQP